jgi:hypothetical protein
VDDLERLGGASPGTIAAALHPSERAGAPEMGTGEWKGMQLPLVQAGDS